MPVTNSNFYNYDFQSLLKTGLPGNTNPSLNIATNISNLPFIQQINQPQHYGSKILPFQQHTEANARPPIRSNEWSPRAPTVGFNG